MPDQNSVAALYGTLTQLAYALSQLSLAPRPPFVMADQGLLSQLGIDSANCAAGLRQKTAATLSQPGVFAAQQQVNTALAMVQLINGPGTNGLVKGAVVAAVQLAIQSVNSL